MVSYRHLKIQAALKGLDDFCDAGVANFPLVNGRCHLKRSLPFETVDAIYNGRLHTSLQRKLKETN